MLYLFRDGPDELGEDIVRNCSCRGSAGYVHPSCAVKYAEQKYDIVLNRKQDDEDPWRICPNCHQDYIDELALHLAKMFVSFIEKNHPHNHTLILRAQVTRLESLTTKNHDRSYNQTKEAEQVANSILHKVRQMKLRQIRITDQDRIYEAHAYEILGCMIVEEGVKRQFPNALRYFEKSLEVSTANKFDHGIVRAKGLIHMVNSNLSGQVNDESLKSHKLMYEQKVDAFGQSSCDTIKTGLQYAKALKNHHHGVKAERLFIELYEISTRYHGHDHELTKGMDDIKAHFMVRVVSVSSNKAGRFQSSQALSTQDYYNDNAMLYQLRQYNESFERCVVKGPLLYSDGPTTNNEISLSSDEVIFVLGTPVAVGVICHGLERVQLGDVRSWNSESKCYTIHWEDESLESCEVHQSNVRAPSCICNNCMKGLELECVLNRNRK